MRMMKMRMQPRSTIQGRLRDSSNPGQMFFLIHPSNMQSGRSQAPFLCLEGPQLDLLRSVIPFHNTHCTIPLHLTTSQTMMKHYEPVFQHFYLLLPLYEVYPSQAKHVLVIPMPPLASIQHLSVWFPSLLL